MKKILTLILIFNFLFSCESTYLNNKYKISDINVRLVDFVGLDSNGCAIHQELDCSRDNEFSGIGVRIYKDFLTDSTKYQTTIGYSPIGKSGRTDSIEVFQIQTNKGVLVNSHFFSDSSKSYISPQKSYYKDYINEYVCSPKNCQCIGVPVFNSTEAFVNAYNSNRTDIIGELLKEEFYFWINKKELKRLANENLILIIRTDHQIWKIQLALPC